MLKHDYLEELWSSSDIDENIRFFEEINDISEFIGFSKNRQKGQVEIFTRGNKDSDIKFIIPTMDPDASICRKIEEMYRNYSILFIKSKGQFFNYSRSLNNGLEKTFSGSNKPKIIVISNDDVILQKTDVSNLENIDFTNNSVYCLTPNNKNYSGEHVVISKANYFETYKDLIISALNNDIAKNKVLRILNHKSIPYAKIRSMKYILDTCILEFYRRMMPNEKTLEFINFADFGIFDANVLRDFKFDELYINGWEDWDLSYRLFNSGLKIKPLNYKFERIGHASIGAVMSRDAEIVRSYFNAIYFNWKHFGNNCSKTYTEGN